MRWRIIKKKTFSNVVRLFILLTLVTGFAFLSIKGEAAVSKEGWNLKKQSLYYQTSNGKIVKNQKRTIGTKSYEFDKVGKLVTPNRRVKTKNGLVYESNGKGSIIKGFDGEIKKNNLHYYSPKDGRELFGWQKIGKSVYFFQLGTGIAQSKQRINDIYLNKLGKANVKKTDTFRKQKMRMLVQAQKIVEEETKPSMTKAKKLRTLFLWSKNIMTSDKYARNAGDGGFYVAKKDKAYAHHWELAYAQAALFREKGNGWNCFVQASSFAFLANALGYKDVKVVTSTGHCWVKIGHLGFDQYRNWYNRKTSTLDDRPICFSAKI